MVNMGARFTGAFLCHTRCRWFLIPRPANARDIHHPDRACLCAPRNFANHLPPPVAGTHDVPLPDITPRDKRDEDHYHQN